MREGVGECEVRESLPGYGSVSEADVAPFLIAKYFGRARFTTLYGSSSTAYAAGAATGPVLMGHAFDKAGTYAPWTVMMFERSCEGESDAAY